MRTARRIRAVGRMLISALALAAAGCGEDLLRPPPDTLQLYILLSPRAAGDTTVSQSAYLLRQETPLGLEYAAADEFRMTREDGLTLAWRHVDPAGLPDPRGFAPLPGPPNYELAAGADGSAGVEALEPGARFTLRIRVDDRTIEGTARIPGRLEITVVERDGQRHLAWSPPAGATGYRLVVLGGSGERTPPVAFTTDTTYPLPDPSVQAWIEAFDANAYAYLSSDPPLDTSGLEGAAGLFGAVVRDSIRFDESD